MAKPWDDLMKMLVGANPQDFVSFLIPRARFESERVTELTNRTVHADLLQNILWLGKKAILHVEFQRRQDSNMGKRLWEYNFLTTYLSGLPVCSFAIYLRKDSKIVESPHEQKLPNGEYSHLFFFKNIKLWELPADVLKQPGLEGILPLLPLTKDGVNRDTIEEMIAGLKAAGKSDLLPLGYAFAALVFKNIVDSEWLKERFQMLEDILEDSWAYQEMVAKGLAKGMEKGLAQGMEKGLEKGKIEALHQAILDIVQARFPELLPSGSSKITSVKDVDTLRQINVKVSIAKTAQEVEELFNAIGEGSKNGKKKKRAPKS